MVSKMATRKLLNFNFIDEKLPEKWQIKCHFKPYSMDVFLFEWLVCITL